MRRICANFALACLMSVFVHAGQTPPSSLHATAQESQVFRAEANLVEVIVRVTDEKGQFVPNLTLKDFELREEGRPQTVVAFDSVNLPRQPTRDAVTGRPLLATPDMSTVSTNAAAGNGRLFVLLLDDMMTSSDFVLPVRRVAREFIERHVGPSDLMAVFSTGGFGVVNQEFTSDKTRILQVIDRFQGRSGPCGPVPRYRGVDAESDPEHVYRIRAATDVMATLAKYLSGVRGRRVSLLWVSEGIGYDGSDPKITQSMNAMTGARSNIGDVGVVADAMRKAIDTLRQANVTLYAVDPRKLWGTGLTGGAHPCEESRRSVDVLRNFSQQTGGFAAVDSNEYRSAFERILDESSQYYVLGFQPSRPGRVGDFRDIQVRVTSRPRLRVSARPGYVVSTPGPPGPRPTSAASVLADALVRNLPMSGLPLQVQAIPRRGTGDTVQVHVVVEVPGKDLTFAEVNARHRERLEFALRSIDSLARVGHEQTTTVMLDLSPAEVSRLRNTGVRWLATLDMEPGHYGLRVVAHGVETDQTGSVFLDIDVPKLEEDRLWIGGLALTSLPAGLAVTGGSSLATLGLPSPPTTARTFVKGDVLTVGAEVTTPANFATGTLQLTVRPQSTGAEVPAVLDKTAALADRSTAQQPRVWTIDTAALGPGTFVLRLTARDDAGHTAGTALLFEVVDR